MDIGYIIAIVFAVILVGFKVAEIVRNKKAKAEAEQKEKSANHSYFES